jgi:nucleotide-binding universal stress UspA family protein
VVSTVAVGVDGSRTSAEAVTMAVELARRFEAQLVLLSVYRHGEDAGASEANDAERRWATDPAARQHEAVARTADRLRQDGVRCTTLTATGQPGDELVRLAEECEADILVVGNKGMQRRVLGSVPNTVTHKAGCSVLVVKTT